MVYDWLLRHLVLVFGIFGIIYLLITVILEHKKKRKVIIFGVYLIISGLFSFITMSAAGSSGAIGGMHARDAPLLSGTHFTHTHYLPEDAHVKGTINDVAGGNLDIDFYVFDETNYNLWKNGHSYTENVFIDGARTGATFSFRTEKADDYYFVFHNPAWLSETDRSVIWSASYECKPYAPYAMPVAIILGVIGAIVIVAGHLAKPKQTVPPPPTLQ